MGAILRSASLILLLVLVAAILIGCGDKGAKAPVTATNGLTTGKPGMNTFSAPPPGQAAKLDRPYEGAPPAIPHSVEGQAVTRTANSCLGCHQTGVEVSKGHTATKIPASHYVNEFSGQSKTESVVGSRYNCVQCHVPQSSEEAPAGAQAP